MRRKLILNPASPIASSPASQYLLPATFFANISFPQPYHGSLLKGCSACWLNAPQVTMEKAPLVPSIISHYKILSKLGEGGMGVVYKAQDTKLDRVVALKFLPHNLTPSEDDKARFLQEGAKTVSALTYSSADTQYLVTILLSYQGGPL